MKVGMGHLVDLADREDTAGTTGVGLSLFIHSMD